MAVVVMRQLAGAQEARRHLQEAEAHQVGAERHRRIDDPGRPFEVGRGRPFRQIARIQAKEIEDRVMCAVLPDEGRAQGADDAGEGCPGQQAEDDEPGAVSVLQAVDQHIDADVDAGAYPIGGAELGHPDKHDDAQLLCPAEIQAQQPVLHAGYRVAGGVAVHHGGEDDQCRRAHEEGDQPFLQVIESLHYFHLPGKSAAPERR
jgi:hypothetical protein